MRWVVEGAFSIFKRIFGEHVMSLRWANIIQEIRLKVALYNRWRNESIARELEEECATHDMRVMPPPRPKLGRYVGTIRTQSYRTRTHNS